MPLKASLGALRQFIDSSSLEKIYFLDLFKTAPMAGGFFDTQGRYQFVTAGPSKRTVQLNAKNVTGDVFTYTGIECDQAGLADNTVLLKYQDVTTAGCDFLTNGNVAITGISRASTNLGNLQLDSSNNHTFTGQTSAGDGYVDCESPNYSKALDKPGNPSQPTPYTFDLYAYDGISDGTNVYIGGSYVTNPSQSGIDGGFLTKIDQFGAIAWDLNVGFIPKHIAFDETGGNLVVAGQSDGPTLYSGFVAKFNTGTGVSPVAASVITNNVASSPAIVRVQSLDVDSTGNIVVGGNYRSSGGVEQNGFVLGLDSSLVQRYMKKFTSTMPGNESMTVKNVSQNKSQDTLCIAGNNNDTSNNYGLLLNVPYDGTSPGTGSYSLAGTITTYTNTTDVTTSTGGTSYASGNVTIATSTAVTGSSTGLVSSTFSFSKLEL